MTQARRDLSEVGPSALGPVDVGGHRRPDTDSIAAAIGCAERRNELGLDLVPIVEDDGGSGFSRWTARRPPRAGRPLGLVTRSDLVGPKLRRVLLVDHAERARSPRDRQLLTALMVTDIPAQNTVLRVAGADGSIERAFGRRRVDGIIDLPGVMSAKQQAAPGLRPAAGGG